MGCAHLANVTVSRGGVRPHWLRRVKMEKGENLHMERLRLDLDPGCDLYHYYDYLVYKSDVSQDHRLGVFQYLT